MCAMGPSQITVTTTVMSTSKQREREREIRIPAVDLVGGEKNSSLGSLLQL